MNRLLLLAGIFSVILISCKNAPEKAKSTETESGKEYSLTELWSSDTLLTTSESVLYDDKTGFLYVSCINGNPSDKDGNGFISRLKSDGSIETLKWAEGLNAPKGMGIFDKNLYVTDIDALTIINLETGKINKRIPVEGAAFLNDVAVDRDGTVYFSDSDIGDIFRYSDGNVQTWISEGLDRPNGLYIETDRVLLTSSGSQDLRLINKKTGEIEVATTEIGYGDGVEFTGMDGYYITSSWAGEVFLIMPDFTKKSLLKTSDQEINSADIGFNKKEMIVYVPTFFDNRVVAYKLEEN